MGEVYRAYDKRLSRWVAIKQIRPDKAGSPSARRRLRREARAAAGLSHPAIVQIFDILDVDQGYWIVMEFVDGQTLASLLKEGPIGVAVVARIGRQIAEGMAHAHEMGIVHRDLKVENVMLSTAGRPRILDFGLVKDLNKTERTQTVDGAILGTLRAMSPEQAMGQPVDNRSDLFSLGTLLYECLSGARPFEASSAAATLQRVVAYAPGPVRHFNPEVPPEFSHLIDRLLEKQPRDRPSARAVIEQLRHVERLLESIDSQTAASLVAEFRRGESTPDLPSYLVASTLEADKENRPSKIIGWRLAGLIIAALLGASAVASFRNSQDIPSQARIRTSPLTGIPEPSGATTEVTLPESPFELYKKGLLLLERDFRPRSLSDSIEMFERTIDIEPNHAGAHAGLARGLLLRFKVAKDAVDLQMALQSAEKAVALDEQLALGHISLGMVHLASGNLDIANGAFNRALVLDPANGLAHLGFGHLSLARKQEKAAEAWYTKATRLGSSRHVAFNHLGTLLYKQGHYEEAAAAFSEARILVPDDATTLRNLGGALHMLGRNEEAAAVLQESLAIEPRASIYNNLGTLLFFQGHYADAARAFERAVDLGPNVYSRWAHLGDAYRWIPGSEQKAREAYGVALELLEDQLAADPDSTNYLSQGSLYSAKLSDCARSANFSKLLDRESVERSVVFFRLGTAAELCNRRDEALKHLGRSMELGYSRKELISEPELRSLRQDARFHRLVLRRPAEPP